MLQYKACSAVYTRKIGGEVGGKAKICQDRRDGQVG
jgi:hypothetical protein